MEKVIIATIVCLCATYIHTYVYKYVQVYMETSWGTEEMADYVSILLGDNVLVMASKQLYAL